MEGFFADPVYGGNRGMAPRKMLGFPGARYDYRDYIEKHDVALSFRPVAILGEEPLDREGLMAWPGCCRARTW